MKKRGILLTACAVLLLFSGCSQKNDAEIQPTDRFFVNDFSNVISESDENTIYSMGAQLQEKTGAQVVAVTLDSLDGETVREKGIAIARDWGIGQKDKNNGILLLLAVEDRKVDIEVGYGLEGDLTDIQTGYLLDTYALPYLKQNDFSSGMRETYRALVNEVYAANGMETPDENYVQAKYKTDGSDSDTTAASRKKLLSYIPAAILVLIFLSFFFRRGRRGGGPPFIFFGGGRGGFGGGGFGGGFTGGGGGFSGGGGGFGGGGGSRGF